MGSREPKTSGATWDGAGTRFSLATAAASSVDLCFFDSKDDVDESRRIPLQPVGATWQARVPGIEPGQLYAFRVDRAGPLLDPYARAICGPRGWRDSVYRSANTPRPKSVVIDPKFDWKGDRRPGVPWSRTVLYEGHVKGMTRLRRDVPETHRGTYLGVAAKATIDSMLELGITSLELLPIHQSVSEPHLADQGLTNYWGYSPVGFFAPDARFASDDRGQQVTEFKTMVRELHRAGIEVILDVVYNHTGESRLFPPLVFAGIDNRNYYRLDPDDPTRDVDWTGCGNTLNLEEPIARGLVLDSLRYWVEEMHVDGFRFDLAGVLARQPDFLNQITGDPTLASVKLIAEPWDAGPDGHFLGRFPTPFAEWNDRYRDTVRRFWRGEPGTLSELATRLAGSSDLFEDSDRPPQASVNFVTSHDGFTLADLVSYEEKHNEENLEENRDGSDHLLSQNFGVEGATTDPLVLESRARMQRNLLATLLLSQGTPMITAGDEIGRTQNGNNNAYCQDNATSWIAPPRGPADRSLLAFTKELLRIRSTHAVLRRDRFFRGPEDLRWLRPDGGEMGAEDWTRPDLHVLGMQRLEEDGTTFLLLLNAGEDDCLFALPGGRWKELIRTARPDSRRELADSVELEPRSLVALHSREEDAP